MDVDNELWAVLDMCSDDELEALHSILHSSSPFSPVLKSLVVRDSEPAMVAQRGRRSVMHKVEAQFRFLAADSSCLLRGSRPSYREILLNVRDKLDVKCSRNLATYDLETEVFLHILNNCVEYVQGPEQPGQQGAGQQPGAPPPVDPSTAAAFATVTAVHDLSSTGPSGSGASGARGGGASTSGAAGAAGAAAAGGGGAGGGGGGGGGNWTERVTAPLRFGLKDLAPTIMNFAGVFTVTKVGQTAAQQLAANLVCSHVRYQAALRAATSGVGGLGGMVAAKGWAKAAVLEAAQHSLTSATARYAALRGAMSLVGPLLWGWLAVDLALKAIGTDYARVVRAVFLLSQVRLVRTHGFVTAEVLDAAAGPGAAAAGGGGPYGDDDSDYEDFLDPGAAYL